MGRPTRGTTPVQRFWAGVVVTEDCWLFGIGINSEGYGHLTVDGKRVKAHRFAYELHHGPIPEGLFVCHSCDVRNCVNPSHLWVGTNAQNIQDMYDKGRVNANKGKHLPSRNKGKTLSTRKTHCKNGHLLAGDNLRRTVRGCRICDNQRHRSKRR